MHFCHQEVMLIAMAFDPALAIWLNLMWAKICTAFNRG